MSMATTEETYLGDGLYVSFDGWQICLRAPRENGDHTVFLEPPVLAAFEAFVQSLRRQAAERASS